VELEDKHQISSAARAQGKIPRRVETIKKVALRFKLESLGHDHHAMVSPRLPLELGGAVEGIDVTAATVAEHRGRMR
jgi:hypothetical protein